MLTKIGKILKDVATGRDSGTFFPEYLTASGGIGLFPVNILNNNAFPLAYVNPLNTGLNSYFGSNTTKIYIRIPKYDSSQKFVYPISSRIILGTGTTPPRETDTMLDAPLVLPSTSTAGNAYDIASTVSIVDDTVNYIQKRIDTFAVPNLFEEPITLTEFGMIVPFNRCSSTFKGSLESNTVAVLIARDLFENPITIPVGESRAIDIITEFDYSSWLEDES